MRYTVVLTALAGVAAAFPLESLLGNDKRDLAPRDFEDDFDIASEPETKRDVEDDSGPFKRDSVQVAEDDFEIPSEPDAKRDFEDDFDVASEPDTKKGDFEDDFDIASEPETKRDFEDDFEIASETDE